MGQRDPEFLEFHAQVNMLWTLIRLPFKLSGFLIGLCVKSVKLIWKIAYSIFSIFFILPIKVYAVLIKLAYKNRDKFRR